MKQLKLFLVLSIISLSAMWSLAVINANGTQPLVNPNGSSEIVGVFTLTFTQPEFQNSSPAGLQRTEFFVIVRVQFADKVKLINIGGTELEDIGCDVVDSIRLAVEGDQAQGLQVTLDPDAVRIVKAYKGSSTIPGYFDILFTKNMVHPAFATISQANPFKVTVGTPDGETPSLAVSNLPRGTQEDTRLCCDFSTSTEDFRNEDFWRVGMITRNAATFYDELNDVYYTNCQLLTPYNASYNPTNPSLAQKGTGTTCDLVPSWPCGKNDQCLPIRNVCHEAAKWHPVCPEVTEDQFGEITDPCDDENEDVIRYGVFSEGVVNGVKGNIFTVTEHCADGSFPYAAGGHLIITLNELKVGNCDLKLEFTEYYTHPVSGLSTPAQAKAWIGGADLPSSATAMEILPNVIAVDDMVTVTPETVEIEIPETLTGWEFDPDRTKPYCISVLLPAVAYDACCLVDVLETTCLDVTVDIDYIPPDFVCGTKPATYEDWKVACIYGCKAVVIPEEQEPYPLILYFPYLPPVESDNPDVKWWCGVAVTNYADHDTEGGTLYLWDEDGNPFSVLVPPLAAHQMWVRNMADWEIAPLGTVTDLNKAMSGILYMTVMAYPTSGKGDYPIKPYKPLPGTFLLENKAEYGAYAGIDAFVLMGDYEQAYGYTARVLNTIFENGPVWNKVRK